MTFTVNPDIAKLEESGVRRRSDVVTLVGLVAKVGKDSVTLQRGLLSQNRYVVPTKSILYSNQSSQGEVVLMVSPDTLIEIHTTAETLAVAKDNDTPPPTDAEIKKCKENARNKCIEDGKVLGASQEGAEQGCDQFIVKWFRDDNCENPVALVRSTSARLGAEIVLATTE